MIEQSLRHFRDISEVEVGKKGKFKIIEYFPQITIEMGCETFIEIKELAWNRFE